MRLKETIGAATRWGNQRARPASAPAAALRGLAAEGLQRLRTARLSPLDGVVLGSLALFAASAGAYLLAALLASVTVESAGKADWRLPTLVATRREPRDLSGVRDTNTLTRPLFEKSRRPAAKRRDAAPAAADAARVGPPPGMALKAIVNHGRDVRVFIVTAATPDGVWLKIGETLEGWTFDGVSKAQVTLKRSGQVAHLEFTYEEGTGGPAGGVIASPAPFAAPPPPAGPLRGPRINRGPS